MWTLLTLLGRSTEADVVAISAMVRNGPAVAEWIQAITERPADVLDLAWKPTRQVRGVVAYEASDIKALRQTLIGRRRKGRYGRKPTCRR